MFDNKLVLIKYNDVLLGGVFSIFSIFSLLYSDYNLLKILSCSLSGILLYSAFKETIVFDDLGIKRGSKYFFNNEINLHTDYTLLWKDFIRYNENDYKFSIISEMDVFEFDLTDYMIRSNDKLRNSIVKFIKTKSNI